MSLVGAVAAVIDDLGHVQGVAAFPTTRHGYRRLLAWMQSHGELFAVGVEGCGSWGAGVARYLTARSVRVVEVNRPNRQNRRRRGKSDTVDAEAAARAVLSGEATVTPKSGDGPVEALRQLRVARNGAIKSRTAAANQLHSLIDTAPDRVREPLIGLTVRKKIAVIERWRPGTTHTPEVAASAPWSAWRAGGGHSISRPANSTDIFTRSCGRSQRRSSHVTASVTRPPVNSS